MTGLWHVTRREYHAYLATPWCYGVAVAFLFLTGVTFFLVVDGSREATLRFWFPNLSFISLVTIPIISSRTLAEEKRMRHLEVLLARPVGIAALVAGKWLAVVALFLTFLAPTLVYVGLLAAWGNPDWPPIVTSYLGAVLLAAFFAALGTMTSALTSNPVLAGLASFATLVTLQLAGSVAAFRPISYVEHLDAFARGAPELSDGVFFVSATAACLTMAALWQTTRRVAFRLQRVMAPAAALTLTAAANWAVVPVDRVFDVTSARQFTLSRASREALANVAGPVTITAFEPAGSAVAKDATTLLGQLQGAKSSLRHRVLDLERYQGEALRLGVDNYGQAAVQVGTRSEVVSPITELGVVSALQRLARRLPQTVCTSTGHGERSTRDQSPKGYAAAKQAIEVNGVAVRDVDLTVDQAIPPECTILAIFDPTTAFRDVELAAIGGFLDRQGRLLLSVEPGGPNLSTITTPWGLRLLPGVVFDPTRSVAGDPTALLVNHFPADSPTTRRVAAAAVPTSGGLTTSASETTGLSVTPVLGSSERSWLELEPATPQPEQHKGDRGGPIVLAGTADHSRVAATGEQRVPSGGPKVDRTRLFVMADADWAANAYVDELGNQALLANVVNWLAGEEDLVAVRGLEPDLRRLSLTEGRRRTMGIVTIGGVPLVALSLGSSLWIWRRRRERR